MRGRTLTAWGLASIVGVLAVSAAGSGEFAPPAKKAAGAAIAEPLALRDYRSAVLSLPATPPDSFHVALELNGTPAVLRLDRYSLRSADYQLLVSAEDGRTEPAPAPEVRTYRGEVVGRPGTMVAASLLPEGLAATILTADGGAWHVQPLPAGAGGRAGEHAVYTVADMLAVEGQCIALEPPGGVVAGAQAGGGAERGSGCHKLCRIAFDADYEFYQLNGSSVSATVADIETVMNGVDLIYARDAGVRFEISATVVRSANPDPYSGTDSNVILNQFRDHWNANHGSISRDTAHLMTGRQVDGSVIGVAWLSVLCGTGYDYGFSESRYTTNLAYRTGLTSHEVGHNFSAGHCNGDSDCWIMCSGIGGCSGNVTKFGERSREAIRSHSLSRPCLGTGAPYPTPMAPTARDDSALAIDGAPVVIDVLANDTDMNCDDLYLAWHQATSTAGGTVSRSVGTGPGGRDELIYTPAPGYEGQDSFRYTVTDDFGVAEAWVRATVVRAREAVNPGFVDVGVHVSYYALSALDALPDFSTLTPYATDVFGSINFTPTGGVFASSGRSDDVGAVFEGFLVVPQDGVYRLFIESDDGSRMLLGDDAIVDNNGLHGMVEQSALVALKAGAHPLRIEFFERGGDAGLIARIEGQGLSKRVIPPAMLLHARPCAADVDGDGILTPGDFTAFRSAYLEGDLAADFNGNGILDSGDFSTFRAAYLAGCH